MAGKFITLEGIDGSGKSTIASLLHEKIDGSILTFEPTDSWIGRSVNKAIEEGMDGITVALLFMADRREHLKEIEKWLSEGKTVICDRFMDSTFAYQSEAIEMENSEEWLRNVHSPFILKPDITFLLVIPPEKAMERIKERKHHAYEYEKFLKKVQENYMKIASMERERFVVINAERSREEVLEDCLKVLKERRLI